MVRRELSGIVEAAVGRGHEVLLLTREEGASNSGFLPAGVKIEVVRGGEGAFLRRLEEYRRGDGGWVTLGLEPLPGLDFCLLQEGLHLGDDLPHPGGRKTLLDQTSGRLRRRLEALFRSPSTTQILYSGEAQKRTLMAEYGVPCPRLREIPPWLDDLRGEPVPTAEEIALMRQAYGCQIPGTILILQPAEEWSAGGVDRSLEALGILPLHIRERCRFLVAGQPSPKSLSLLQQASRKLGFPEGQLRYLPTLQHARCLMAAADLMLLPARDDFHGLLLADALQCSLPVLCTPLSAQAELARAAGCPVLPDPFDQEVLDDMLAWTLPSLPVFRQRLRSLHQSDERPSRAQAILALLEAGNPLSSRENPPQEVCQEILSEHLAQTERHGALKQDKKRSISRCVDPRGGTLILKEFRRRHFWEGARHVKRCQECTARMAGFTALSRGRGRLPDGGDYLLLGDCGEGNFFLTDYAALPDAPELYAECGRILADLHAAGIFHLDTKPANFVRNSHCTRECPYRVCLVDCDNVRLDPLPMPLTHRAKNLAQFLAGTGRLARQDATRWQECLRAFHAGYSRACLLDPLWIGRTWAAVWDLLEQGGHVEYTLPDPHPGECLQFLREDLH